MANKILKKGSVKNKGYNRTVVSLRRGIINAAKKNGGQVSAVDVKGIMPSVTGSSRGAMVRQAFTSLVGENAIRIVKRKGVTQTVYNSDTRHRVTLYAVRKQRAATTKTAIATKR